MPQADAALRRIPPGGCPPGLNMVAAIRREAFGSCSNHGECEAVCPKGIPLEFIARLNRDVVRAAFRPRREPLHVHGAPLHPAHEEA